MSEPLKYSIRELLEFNSELIAKAKLEQENHDEEESPGLVAVLENSNRCYFQDLADCMG